MPLRPDPGPVELSAAAVTSSGAGLDDDALLRASADGDAAAFRRLVERHRDRAFAVALRLCSHRGDAEDAVQEAFARAWSKSSTWRAGGAAFPTWLHRVLVNLCLDRLRAGRRRQHADLDAAAEVPDPAPVAEERLAQSRRLDRLRRAVAALPERQRAALALTLAGGLSNAAAGEALDVSEGAIESLLVRARRDLRRRLADLDGEGR
jgi:RNA polymerase sigma-70 factor (ECF subfamily)